MQTTTRNTATVIVELIRHAVTGRTDGPMRARVGVTTKAHGYTARFLVDPSDTEEAPALVRREAFAAARAILGAFAGDPEAGWPTISVEPIDPTNPSVGTLVDVTYVR